MFKTHKTLIICLISILTTVLVAITSFTCFATTKTYTSFGDLIENGKALNDKKISIKGEAIGEPMKRGIHTWINISDGGTAIGLWLTNEDAEKVITYGDYKKKGDIIEATATFHRACKEHAGDMDLHVDKFSIIEKGFMFNKTISKNKILASLLLSGITILLSIVYVKKYHK